MIITVLLGTQIKPKKFEENLGISPYVNLMGPCMEGFLRQAWKSECHGFCSDSA